VLPTKAGKIATGIAGMTGTSSLGITACALTRIASAQAVPTGIWVVLAWLSTTTAAVAGLGVVLDYERAKLEIAARAGAVRSRADLEAARLAMYRGLVEKSAEAAGTAARYRDLVLADALHLAVEQNGGQPAGRTAGQLSRPRGEARPIGREAPE
jgi:hypothetical protein